MQVPRPVWIVAAVFVVACGGTVIAQSMLEQTTVTTSRTAPAEVDLGDQVVARLAVPAGFQVSVWASGLGRPRMIETAADGTVYATRRDTGDVIALRDANGDGRAEAPVVFAGGLPNVNGIDRVGSNLYLASSTTVWRTPIAAQATPVVVVSGLPDGGQHGNRMVRFGPDGLMYVSVGSSCNDCAEQNQLERATIIRYAADGTGRTVIANGLRNTIGYDWHPVTGQLWGMDHGSDFRGDELPPEELNAIRIGAQHGWPICYADRVVDPVTNAQPMLVARQPGQAMPPLVPISRSEFCAATEPSRLTYTAHSAPMAMRFYTATQFPAAYRNDAFVAMRGSWNKAQPSGYKIVRIRFDSGGNALSIEDFVTGFVRNDGSELYGRPVGITFLPDGSMLFSDDTIGTIYRVAWVG